MNQKEKKVVRFDIITIFPKIFENYFSTSIIKRAKKRGLIKIKIHNLRDFATDKHKTVDDKPYGGGPGMILKIEPIYKAICSILRKSQIPSTKSQINPKSKIKNAKIVLLTPVGKQFDQKMAKSFSKLNQLILICGRYEGIDARVEKFVDEKISIGPYVLTGGELPAMAIVDAITRLIPGVIRDESLKEETFNEVQINADQDADRRGNISVNLRGNQRKSATANRVSGEYPQYTRPEVLTIHNKSGKIKVLRVPKVLLSGDHRKIREWREKQMVKNK